MIFNPIAEIVNDPLGISMKNSFI